jgi:hypothetical protein
VTIYLLQLQNSVSLCMCAFYGQRQNSDNVADGPTILKNYCFFWSAVDIGRSFLNTSSTVGLYLFHGIVMNNCGHRLTNADNARPHSSVYIRVLECISFLVFFSFILVTANFGFFKKTTNILHFLRKINCGSILWLCFHLFLRVVASFSTSICRWPMNVARLFFSFTVAQERRHIWQFRDICDRARHIRSLLTAAGQCEQCPISILGCNIFHIVGIELSQSWVVPKGEEITTI